MFELLSATADFTVWHWLLLTVCLSLGIAVLSRRFGKQLKSVAEFVLVISLISILTVIAGIIEH